MEEKKPKKLNHIDLKRKLFREQDDIRVDLKQSITEMRVIYKELTDEQFAKWYSRRYHVKQEAILRYLQGVGNPAK